MPPVRHGLMEMGYTKVRGEAAGGGGQVSVAVWILGAGRQAFGSCWGTCIACDSGCHACAPVDPKLQHYHHRGTSDSDSSSSSSTTTTSGVDYTFTACTSASGTLLLGSSREFAPGFDCQVGVEAVADSILSLAATFLPVLAGLRFQDLIEVRAGPRPYASGGLPMVGPVPGAPGLYVAAGHEGSGLTLAPATAELVADMLLGRQPALSADVVDSLRVPFD